MVQLVVWFRPEFSVNYRGGVFVSPAMQAIAPVNDILHGYPDAQVESLFQDGVATLAFLRSIMTQEVSACHTTDNYY